MSIMTKTDQQPNPGMTKEAREEMQHFKKVISAFKSYKRDSDTRLARSNINLKRLPLQHQQIINKHGFKSSLESLQSCIDLNYRVISEIIGESDKMFENSDAQYNNEKDGKYSLHIINGWAIVWGIS